MTKPPQEAAFVGSAGVVLFSCTSRDYSKKYSIIREICSHRRCSRRCSRICSLKCSPIFLSPCSIGFIHPCLPNGLRVLQRHIFKRGKGMGGLTGKAKLSGKATESDDFRHFRRNYRKSSLWTLLSAEQRCIPVRKPTAAMGIIALSNKQMRSL